jgi:hypothetical protein
MLDPGSASLQPVFLTGRPSIKKTVGLAQIKKAAL